MISKRCYYLEMVRMTYEEAKANCASKFLNSGKLFEPLSLQVNDLVWEEFKDTIVPNGYGPWIGVNNQERNSVYKYSSSGSEVSFTIPWKHGLHGQANRGCIYMWREAKWVDRSCTPSQVSICEHQ